MNDPIIYTTDRTPDLTGARGSAWRSDVEGMARRRPAGPPKELTVAAWIATAPYAHPLWHSYAIGCISLRHVDGWPAAQIMLPGATHEIFVIALDPDHPVPLNDAPRHLTPLNFAGQFVAESDAAAAERVERAVQDVIDGRLNPDTDYIRHWMYRFSDSNIRDKEHAGETKIILGGGADNPVEMVIPPVPGPQDLH